MKTIIFLGAGASASEGAPMQNNLFYEYFKLIKERNNNGVTYKLYGMNMPQYGQIESALADFFQHMFDIYVGIGFHKDSDVYFEVGLDALAKIAFPTFEEVLGILDLAKIKNESYKCYPNFSMSRITSIHDIRLYLTYLMADVIHHKLCSPKGFHSKLIKNLNAIDHLNNVSFISTNYDILIDNALLEIDPDITIDYGVDFADFNEPNPCSKRGPNNVKLFKIHGSLNWLHCSSCNKLRLTPQKKGLVNLLLLDLEDVDISCYWCGSLYSPVIIPPTFYKEFNNFFLNQVYSKAEQELYNANHLIFCGYSFPDADMHIKYMVKRAQKNRIWLEDLKITVINNHKGKNISLKEEESSRYERFLSSKIQYTEYSFEDFANNPHIVF